MKILLLDIETAPNKVYTWDVWNQNIDSSKMVDTSYVMCWTAKWLDEKKIFFSAIWEEDEEFMVAKMHALLDETDVVVHYNGTKFDIPILNREFVKFGMAPPSPYKQVDLYRVVRRNFKFVYNKLDFVAKELNIGQKKEHKGFQLWVDCMEGVKESQQVMKEYNIEDVHLLERLYYKLLGWIKNHPNHMAYTDVQVCPKCGSKHTQRRGFSVAKTLKYKRFQCQGCGGWFRANKAEAKTAAQATMNISD